jgi:hypothetical protein
MYRPADKIADSAWRAGLRRAALFQVQTCGVSMAHERQNICLDALQAIKGPGSCMSVPGLVTSEMPYPNTGIGHATAQGPPTVGNFQARLVSL